jgi:hypothetical protein
MLTISEIFTFPHQFKFFGAIGWCTLANMISEPDISSLNSDRRDLSK